jgi:tetratricopeptide (TPR) repeat protein
MKTLSLLLIILSFGIAPAPSQNRTPAGDEKSQFCNGTEISFDVTAVETLYHLPHEVLRNIDSFWNSNQGYRLTMQYHINNRVPLDMEEWRARAEEIAALTEAEANEQPALRTVRGIVELKPVLMDRGIQHISSFLPADAPPVNVPVYLISDIKPAAFAYPGGILMNVNSPRFNGDPSVIMNIITHEVYHCGFANTIAYRTEYELENEPLDFVLSFLLNEGMATYVSFSARDFFPNDFVPDYRMMQDPEQVRKNIEKVDNLFEQAVYISGDSIRKAAWQTGIIERSFYIAGGYMAWIIEQKRGREALVEAMCAGPLSFISLYNSLADEGMKIKEPPLPGKISPHQNLRLALARNDTTEFSRLATEMMQQVEEADDLCEKAVNRYGYTFMRTHGGIENALRLFRLNVNLFPSSYRAYDSLGECFMVAGNNELAIANYEKSLSLNPANKNAERILEKLRQQQ